MNKFSAVAFSIIAALTLGVSTVRGGDLDTVVYFPLVAAKTQIDRIQPIGDSITLGFPCDSGWRGMISQSGFQFVGTIDGVHDGHGGWWTAGNPSGENILDFVQSWTSASDPDYVILSAGMNDYLNNALDPQKIVDVLALVDVPVILMGIPNVAPVPDAAITAYNADLAEIAAARGLAFVDIESVLTPSDMDSDGIHPNCTGYAKIAAALTPAIATR